MEVQAKRCDTCIYTKGSPLHGNLEKYRREALAKDSHRICHNSNTAVCRGFFDIDGDAVNLVRIAKRLGVVKLVTRKHGVKKI